MNKPAIATIIATAALSIAKKASGSHNQGVTVNSLDELIRHVNDPNLAPLVTKVDLYPSNAYELPSEIGNLNNLKELMLIRNQITSIPPEIGNLTNLKFLDLRGNRINSFPPEIWNLTNLESLNLSSCGRKLIPLGIGNLTNLKELSLFNNKITEITPEVWNLTNLTILNLAFNEIKSVPPEIGNLTNLKELGLDYNLNLKIPASTIRRAIQSGMNPYIIKKLMEHLDTTPRSPIRRF